MDVPKQKQKVNTVRLGLIVVGLMVASLAAKGVWESQSANFGLPEVKRQTLMIGTAERGPLLREVQGLGTLQPDEVRMVAAPSLGVVEKILVRPGAAVTSQTVILVLSNPELELAQNELKWQVQEAEAKLQDLTAKLETASLELRSSIARLESEAKQATLKFDREAKLHREGLTSELNVKLLQSASEEYTSRLQLERKRLDSLTPSSKAQLAVQDVQIAKLREAFRLKQRQVADLNVTAGSAGILQTMLVEVGQNLALGTLVAKVADSDRLMARLQVAEGEMKEVRLGQPVAVDTHQGIVSGNVERIVPASVNGMVSIEVKLIGELPATARPDLSVTGRIGLETIGEAVKIPRPSGVVEGQKWSTFVVNKDGETAKRKEVTLGRSSAKEMEVLAGLSDGERVILSDMEEFAKFASIKLQ
jgi:HlyD family secretion protein